MTVISSSSGSGFLLDELLDESGSWSLQTNDDESNLNVLYAKNPDYRYLFEYMLHLTHGIYISHTR